ncbi:MAG TPA: hypothetical protein VGC88_00720 [Terriglobales bacterium]|jgi:hypothetical protein
MFDRMWDIVLFLALLYAVGGLSLVATYIVQRLYLQMREHNAPTSAAPAAVCEVTTSSRTATAS